jgi:regulator of replication initiation timing
MKTRKRELARPGIYGTVENPIVVLETDLREIAETFSDVVKAPVSLNGHWPDPAKPRLGNVTSVTYDEEARVLSGEIEEQDALAKAVEEGFFPDCSIGSRRRASDGKMYLHHLAYLGEEPPAVKNLVSEIIRSLESPELKLAASEAGACLMLPPPKAARLRLSDPAHTEKSAGDSGKTQDNKEAHSMDELEKAKAELAANAEKISALEAENDKLREELASLAEKYPDEGIELSDGDPRVKSLMRDLREGKKAALMEAASRKVPKAKQPLVARLAESFSVGAGIELSDGDTKKSVSQFDLLAEIFAAVLPPVKTGALELSDGEEPEGEGKCAVSSRELINNF